MIEEYYEERVRHIRSLHRTNDDELAFAQSIPDDADTIEVVTTNNETETITRVNVYTQQAVYHFQTFRADYVGHGSRTLTELLMHFKVSLPIEFIVTHKTFTIYLTGQKIVVGETIGGNDDQPGESEIPEFKDNEFPIAMRNGLFQLVVYFEDLMSASVAEQLSYLAEYYNVDPIEVIENAVSAMFDLRVLEEEAAELERQRLEAEGQAQTESVPVVVGEDYNAPVVN